MPEAPAQSQTDAEQQAPAPAGSVEPATETQDGVARLAATLQELQARHDELLHRFLTLIEERRALDQALFAERFKTAGLQRDLGVFQHQWHATRTELTEIRAQRDHHEKLCRELQGQLLEMRALLDRQVQLNKGLQQELHDIRHSRVWLLGQKYWNLTRRVKAPLGR
jgi:chromosome segregation ATPase